MIEQTELKHLAEKILVDMKVIKYQMTSEELNEALKTIKGLKCSTRVRLRILANEYPLYIKLGDTRLVFFVQKKSRDCYTVSLRPDGVQFANSIYVDENSEVFYVDEKKRHIQATKQYLDKLIPLKGECRHRVTH